MRTVPLLLLFVFVNSLHIPTDLIRGQYPGEKHYVGHLYFGTPPEPLKLEISFKVDSLVLYRDQRKHSISYYAHNPSEIVYFNDIHFRLPIEYNPHRSFDDFDIQCFDCDGVLGLGKGSPFWQIWKDASFSHSSIMVNDLNPLIQGYSGDCKGAFLKCEEGSSICTTSATLLNDNKVYPVNIDFESPIVYLPHGFYDEYMRQKNLYLDDIDSWPKIELEFHNSVPTDEHLIANLRGRGLNPMSCDNEIKFVVDPNHMIHEFEVEGKILLIKSNLSPNDTSITLGNNIWDHFLLHRTHQGEFLYVQSHPLQDHASVGALILFLFIFSFFIRWKLTSISYFVKDRKVLRILNGLNLFYEVTAPFLVFGAFFFPNIRNVMQDFPALLYSSFGIFLYATALNFVLIAIYIPTLTSKRVSAVVKKNLLLNFELNFLRNVTHETVLMIGMWVILLEKRDEGVANAISVFINVYNMFNISVHFNVFVIGSAYYLINPKRHRNSLGTWGLAAFTILGLLFAQVFISYVFFADPFLQKNSQIYKQIILPFLITLYIVLFSIAIYISSLKFKVAIYQVLKEKEKEGKEPILSIKNE